MTRKKGMSIGESLRGRMTSSGQDDTTDESADAINVARDRDTVQVEATDRQDAHAMTQSTDPLESFNTRLRQSTQRRLKVYSAIHNVKIQDIVNEAISSYLDSKQD